MSNKTFRKLQYEGEKATLTFLPTFAKGVACVKKSVPPMFWTGVRS
ncbi:MAG: hypothetical protein DDT19_01029 [Syntrophomonadaceae bacterium]|nr:hypothetical protein [Bacillota bacterium]